MRALHAVLRALTASFRPPGMSAGYQLTLPVPPLSTVYGLLAAAVGKDVSPEQVWLGYRFHYDAEAEDLETIILFSKGGPSWDDKMGQVRSMPIHRQFVVNPVLHLYLPAEEWLWRALRNPRYPLLLGRSQDVATVDHMEEVELQLAQEGEAEGILLPFPTPGVQSFVYNLPTYLPTHPPRRALAVKPFQLVQQRQRVRREDGLLYREPQEGLLVPVYTREWLG
ncbi:MAG: type I-B CRISPR-associated protein Cas5b [Armatimonadota bacterium]|nr:type I-B CRISPR-associated protein Cas5b [Armatimonadota bacterium]